MKFLAALLLLTITHPAVAQTPSLEMQKDIPEAISVHQTFTIAKSKYTVFGEELCQAISDNREFYYCRDRVDSKKNENPYAIILQACQVIPKYMDMGAGHYEVDCFRAGMKLIKKYHLEMSVDKTSLDDLKGCVYVDYGHSFCGGIQADFQHFNEKFATEHQSPPPPQEAGAPQEGSHSVP